MDDDRFKSLDSPDPAARRTATISLSMRPFQGEERSLLVRTLGNVLRDPSIGVQEAALEALVRQGGADVAAQFFSLLGEQATIRNLALEGLRQLGQDALPILVQATEHANHHIRKFAADLLGEISPSPQTGQVLFPLLRDASPNVRMSAVQALGRVRPPSAVEALIRCCHEEQEPWVRFSVIEALGMLGDAQALPTLQELLASEDMALRCATVEAMRRIGRPEVLPDLLAQLPVAGRPLRHYLIVAIIRLMDPQSDVLRQEAIKSFVFQELIEALGIRGAEVSLAAVQGLMLLKDSQATVPLLNLLNTLEPSRDTALMTAIGSALLLLGSPQSLMEGMHSSREHVAQACIEALGQRHVVDACPALCALARENENRNIRLAALKAIERIGMLDSTVKEVIVSAIHADSGYLRGQGARMVRTFSLVEGGPQLLAALNSERYSDVMQKQVEALLAVDKEAFSSRLTALLRHERGEVRLVTVTACAGFSHRDLAPFLLAHAGDSDWRVRVAILEYFIAHPDVGGSTWIIRSLADEHSQVRKAAVSALAMAKIPEANQLLCTNGLEDSDMWVRVRTVEELAKQKDRAVGPSLIKRLQDRAVPVRIAAVKALGAVGYRQAIPALRQLQEAEKDPENMQVLTQTLKQLQFIPAGEVHAW